jgi:hypothetical protein
MAAPAAAKDGNSGDHGNSSGHGNADVAHSKSGPGNASDAAAANANPNANLGVGASGDHAATSGVFLAVITPQATGSTSALVFTNTGSQAGTAVVTLYAADTGAQLATFTTASVPALGSRAVNVADVLAGATPALTTAQAGSVLDAGVSASFAGDVQLESANATAADNLTDCGKGLGAAEKVLGNVAGPGSAGFVDAVRIVNAGSQSGHVTLTIHDATDGSTLGTWTSADVPAHGSLTTGVGAIAAAATPVVAATKTTLVIAADQLSGDLSLQHLSQVKGATAVTDMSAVCTMHGGGAQATHSGSSGDDGNNSSDDGAGDTGDDAGTTTATPPAPAPR